MSNSLAAEYGTESSTVPHLTNKTEKFMKVSESFSSRTKLKSLIINELNYMDVLTKTKPVIQDREESIAKAFQFGFQSANIRVKSTFSRSSRIALMHMIHQETLNTSAMKSFDQLSQFEIFMSVLVENLCFQMTRT